MDFVKKLGSGELSLDDEQVPRLKLTVDILGLSVLCPQVIAPGDSKDWGQEFLKQGGQELKQDTDFWERMEREWQDMAKYVHPVEALQMRSCAPPPPGSRPTPG